MRPVNDATFELIRSFEGLYLEAYKDEVGVWTIGYGHTNYDKRGPRVSKGVTLANEREAVQILRQDLADNADDIAALILPRPLQEMNDNMFGALVSFTFNLGIDNLKKSTLLRRINARDYAAALPEFLKWNRAGGKELRGLTRRRKSEANLFCGFPNPVVPA